MAIIDVIKFNGIRNRDWLVYRYPRENFVFGTQLIVGEEQIAVFVKGGKALDFLNNKYQIYKSNDFVQRIVFLKDNNNELIGEDSNIINEGELNINDENLDILDKGIIQGK